MIRLSRRARFLVCGFGFVARTVGYSFIIKQMEWVPTRLIIVNKERLCWLVGGTNFISLNWAYNHDISMILALFGRLFFWLISRPWLICCERKTLFHG
jgi:hypothetical protein